MLDSSQPSSHDLLTDTSGTTYDLISMEFHPVVDLFPPMSADEFEALCLDIATHGLREPIFLADGKIADGRNRYKACLEIKEPPRYRDWDGHGDLTAIVVSLNLKRRHLDESQRAMVAGKLANISKAGRPGANSANLPNISQAAAATMLNVSTRSVTAAAKVQRKGDPELIEAVAAGVISVAEGARIADMPKASQKRLVKRGRRAGKNILNRLKGASVKKAYRLGCLNCDPTVKASKETVSMLMQRLARKYPDFAWCFNDVVEELESSELSDETRANYDRILEAIDLGYQTEDLIASRTGIDRDHLRHALTTMVDYGKIEPKKEIKKTDQARGATKTIYVRVERDQDEDSDLFFEIEDVDPADELLDKEFPL